MDFIRTCAKAVARTPLHPQWLLGRRRMPVGLNTLVGSLLDIGAADRWLEGHLSEHVDYVALDFPSTGRDLYAAHPDVFADGANLPFHDGHFSGVICLEVLEHVPDPAKVMLEIARVLKIGGRAWISMPFLYPLHDAPYDFQRYTEFGLRRDVALAGLELVTLQKSGHAIRTAGLLMCLAVSGGAYARTGLLGILLLPFALAVVWATNVSAWFASLIWPDWKNVASGHEIEVRKP